MSRKPTSKRTRPKPKAVLRLPDLDQAKSAVLNSLTSGDAPNVDTASVVTSQAAMRGQCKTGHARKPSGTRLFYSAACCGGKSVSVRQLRGPHLSTCP